jgi:hypothetical protein
MSVGCATIAASLQSCHSQLTYACNIPSAVCLAPPEDEQLMLEACRSPWFSINWMKSASCWFHDTGILRMMHGQQNIETLYSNCFMHYTCAKLWNCDRHVSFFFFMTIGCSCLVCRTEMEKEEMGWRDFIWELTLHDKYYVPYKDFLNPLPLLFKALRHGQKDRVFFSGHLIYILKQERFRAFRPARDI